MNCEARRVIAPLGGICWYMLNKDPCKPKDSLKEVEDTQAYSGAY